MSEEEKKAIELLKQEPDFSLNYYNRENAIDIVLNLIEKQQAKLEQQKEIEKNRTAPKYMFTIIYKIKDSDGCCRGEECKVSLIAGTLEQAKIKLNKIEPDKCDAIKTILKWSAEELLEERN